MIFKLPTLYKRDTNGNIRELTVEYSNGVLNATRTIAGIKDGNLVTSGWKDATGKNTGKANATTDAEQAQKEAQAMWDKKVEKEYFEDISKVDTYDKFKPMLAQDYAKLDSGKRMQLDMISQPKLDGIRCIARKDGLFTRAGKEITTCNHIHNALKDYFEKNPTDILDGELYNHELKADFNKITSLVRKVKPTQAEAEECAKIIGSRIAPHARIIWGATTEASEQEGYVRVLVVLTGVRSEQIHGSRKRADLVDARARSIQFIG